MNKLVLLIPFFNESKLLIDHLNNLEKFLNENEYFEKFQTTIVLIDDGSKSRLPESKFSQNVVLLRHLVNLGQGAAIQTGIDYARTALTSDFFVTMDADGQHKCDDLPAILCPVVEGQSDITFGNRFNDNTLNIPQVRYWILKCAILFEKFVTRLDLGDSHNGYRAFNREVAGSIKIQLNRMAHATEIKQIVAREGFRYSEVPVCISYSNETIAKGQKNIGAILILKDLIIAYFFRKTAGN